MGIIIKNTIKSSIANYIGVVLGIISVLYLQTWILSPGEIGKIQLIIDKIFLFSPFILFGTLNAFPRFSHLFDNKKNYSNFVSWSLFLPLITTTLSCIIFYFYKVDKEHIYVFFAILFLSLYIRIIENILTTKAKIVYPTILRAIIFRIMMISLLTLLYFNLFDFNGFIMAFAGIHCIHLLLLLPYFIKNTSFQFRLDFSFFKHPSFKSILTYCGYSILGTGTGILITKLDSVMIKGILGDYSLVGIYAIAASISMLIDMPRRPISQLSISILSQNLHENNLSEVKNIYNKSAINLFIVGGIMFILIWINIDSIFLIMNNGEKYSSGKLVVLFLGLAKVVDMGFGLNSEIISSSKFYKWNIFIMPFLAVISISLNLIFIPQYAIVGSALATLISVFTYNVLRAIIVYKKLNIHSFSTKFIYVGILISLPIMVAHFVPLLSNAYLDIVINSGLVLILTILPIYFFRLSNEINGIVNKGLKMINLK